MTNNFPSEKLNDYISLGVFPTPLEKLSRLTKLLEGPEIWIKRDDLTGLALGGNKVRKLEYLMADALRKKSDCILTAGAAQSNHCRQSAAAAAKLGLKCYLALGGEKPKSFQGNLLLDNLFGAQIHWTGEERKGESLDSIMNRLRDRGENPYLIPYGGSNEIGALGFVRGVKELADSPEAERFSHVVFASSSGGTHAGMIAGKILTGLPFKPLGIAIDKEEASPEKTVDELVYSTARLLGMEGKINEKAEFIHGYKGHGYGVLNNNDKEAISLLAETEGILTDPVYSGRALAGLIGLIRQGYFEKGDTVLFWHTGGAPALFSYADELSC